MVAKIAKIPPRSVSSSDKEQLQTLDRDLKLVVFGQDAAIDTLASTIKLSRSGLGHPEKPIGCFLLRDRRASERPNWPNNSPRSWGSSFSAST